MCKEELCYLGGEGNSKFMEEYQIKRILAELIDRGIRIRFLFGPNYDIRSATFLKWGKEKKVEIKWLPERAEEEHFKVVDKSYVQVANKHAALEEERKGYTYYSPRKALRRWKEFERRWEEAEVFDVEDRIKEAEEKYDEFKKQGVRKGQCEWGFSAGFIKREEEGQVIPANKEEIEKLKKVVGI